MAYVDALYDRTKDRIHVVERVDGKRVYREYPAVYQFYYDDPKGKHRSIFGTPVAKFTTKRYKEFQKEFRMRSRKRTYESDIKPVVRCLADNYLNAEPPKLHTCFLDIETGFHSEFGYAPPSDPFNPITAITVYLDWADQLITLVMPPETLPVDKAQEIASGFENTFVFTDEREMFDVLFNLIEDADVITGWNSGTFDIPYMVNRVTKIMSKEATRKFCLFNQLPIQRTFTRFEQEQETYDLIGRIHMDYLDLYKKYNYEQRHSYKLDYIGEIEVKEHKIPYEGSLDQLYRKDWNRFIEYSRQDVMLLYKIHQKVQFLELANQIAHQNTVLIPTVLGSVAQIEQAIINEAHHYGLVVPDRPKRNFDTEEEELDNDEFDPDKAAGAYVAAPKKGMHEWIGAVDLNSLYPSAIRALNMAPETIIGQIRPTLTDAYIAGKMESKIANGKKVKGSSFAAAWEGLFGSLEFNLVMEEDRATKLIVDWEDGSSNEATGAEIHKLIFEGKQPWLITANGTIFTYAKEGVIPSLLSRWYTERKQLQKQQREATTKEEKDFFNKRQLVRKILLNSAYGALLNEHCRFYDKRIGQSVTLSGRQIVRHMMGHINQSITGEYDHNGSATVYGDTDSCYFSAYPSLKAQIESGELEWTKELCVKLYDAIAEAANDSFPEFMLRTFHCPTKNGAIIKAGRELVADRGIFITKKRYALNVFDNEGDRLDLYDEQKATKEGVVYGMGKVKAMGLDLKRSDTPVFIQKFLMGVLIDVLAGKDRASVVETIRAFKHELAKKPSWEKGRPQSVKKMKTYGDALAANQNGKTNMPGHVRAALNWNRLRWLNNDKHSMQIMDGMKIVVCMLKPNAMNMESIAYPTDELHLPDWFLELPLDDAGMEEKLVDEKIENLLKVLNWELKKDINSDPSFESFFVYD